MDHLVLPLRRNGSDDTEARRLKELILMTMEELPEIAVGLDSERSIRRKGTNSRIMGNCRMFDGGASEARVAERQRSRCPDVGYSLRGSVRPWPAYRNA